MEGGEKQTQTPNSLSANRRIKYQNQKFLFSTWSEFLHHGRFAHIPGKGIIICFQPETSYCIRKGNCTSPSIDLNPVPNAHLCLSPLLLAFNNQVIQISICLVSKISSVPPFNSGSMYLPYSHLISTVSCKTHKHRYQQH